MLLPSIPNTQSSLPLTPLPATHTASTSTPDFSLALMAASQHGHQPLLAHSHHTGFDIASSLECRFIYWSLFFLVAVALWAVQSLISAQAYYATLFPEANLAIYGMLWMGLANFVAQLVVLLFNLDHLLTFRWRVYGGYGALFVLALLLVAVRQHWAIHIAFGGMGLACRALL